MPATETAPDKPATGASRRTWALAALVVLIVLGLAWPAWRQRAQAQAPQAQPSQANAVPVATTRVLRQDVEIAATGMGNVLPIASVTVRTRVDGQLDSVAFQEGQEVKAGQLLARLDARGFAAQLQQAQAQQARDAAQLANARLDLQRYTELIQEDAATRQQLDTQQALVRQLTAAVQNDAAQVRLAQVQLDYTTIRAPIAGRIGARLVDPGNIVHAADPGGLLVINQIDPIAVQFTLPEAIFPALQRALQEGRRDGLAVQALERGPRTLLATGRLTLLNNQIDTGTGTILLKAHFPNAGRRLWPGQAVQARLVLGTQPGALTVPSAAVQRGPHGLYVYAVDGAGKARVQDITAGSSEQGRTVVAEGLAEGERVVVDGQYRLTPGALVREATADAAQQSGGGS